jgi:hypothetical protein
MTEHLEKCLSHCPCGKWFTEDDMCMLKRSRYVLDSLEKNGKLKSRVKFDKVPMTIKYFKVIQPKKDKK